MKIYMYVCGGTLVKQAAFSLYTTKFVYVWLDRELRWKINEKKRNIDLELIRIPI